MVLLQFKPMDFILLDLQMFRYYFGQEHIIKLEHITRELIIS